MANGGGSTLDDLVHPHIAKFEFLVPSNVSVGHYLSLSSSFPPTLRLNCLYEGTYAASIIVYLQLFRKSSLRFYFSEDFFDPNLTARVVKDAFLFLGLDPRASDIESAVKEIHNKDYRNNKEEHTFSSAVILKMQGTMAPWNGALEALLRHPLPSTWRYPRFLDKFLATKAEVTSGLKSRRESHRHRKPPMG